MNKTIANQFLLFCQSIRISPEFIESILETGDESLGNLLTKISQLHPTVISSEICNEIQDSFIITPAFKPNESFEEAKKIVKEMFPDLGNGFGK